MIGLRLDPVDTWFFRGGTPFSAGASPQDQVESLFPPFPATVAGALRAALARAKDWNGRGSWAVKLNSVLGDGPQCLGSLSFYGPFLLRDGQPLFRVPRHLLGFSDEAAEDGSGQWRPRVLLRPGEEVLCDLGRVRLPAIPQNREEELKALAGDLKPGDDKWLTLDGMKKILQGELPSVDDLVSRDDLWQDELRIGLERDQKTRTAQEGMLYSTRHVRPCSGVSLGVVVKGLPEDWHLPPGFLPLGGESRLAFCQAWDGWNQKLKFAPAAVSGTGKVAVVALTPLMLDRAHLRGEQPIETLGDARVVSACLERPQRVGGWNSLKRKPLPLRSVLPAGSLLFCELPESGLTSLETENGLVRLGAQIASGFGLAALAAWPD